MGFESFISVSVPAADRSLLTIEELRSAAGVTGSGSDARLIQVGKRAAAAISKACRLITDGVNPPTLLRETIVETFRLDSQLLSGAWPYYDTARTQRVSQNSLILSRFPATSVVSIVADGAVLNGSDYELRAAEGRLVRLLNDTVTSWFGSKIVVTYVGGYAAVPDDLALAASQFVGILWSEDGRDLNVRSEAVEGIGRTDYFELNAQRDIVPAPILGMLSDGGYVNAFHG